MLHFNTLHNGKKVYITIYAVCNLFQLLGYDGGQVLQDAVLRKALPDVEENFPQISTFSPNWCALLCTIVLRMGEKNSVLWWCQSDIAAASVSKKSMVPLYWHYISTLWNIFFFKCVLMHFLEGDLQIVRNCCCQQCLIFGLVQCAGSLVLLPGLFVWTGGYAERGEACGPDTKQTNVQEEHPWGTSAMNTNKLCVFPWFMGLISFVSHWIFAYVHENAWFTSSFVNRAFD